MKIDLLQFIPKTISGFEVFVEKEFVDNEEWLKIWYKQNRVIPIRIKRFVDAKSFGAMLGQYQAEGTKFNGAKRKFALEFSNRNILEHKEFFDRLKEFGVEDRMISFEFRDSSGMKREIIENLKDEFESKVGKVKKEYFHFSKRGGYGFRTLVRSTILTHIILSAMNSLRKSCIREPEVYREFLDSFFAKLLTGDGTINPDKRNPVPRVHIAIKDQNKEYLKDYSEMMKTLGFGYVRIYEKDYKVEANCSFENLLYLYKIKAFYNINNWNKLLVTIGLFLNGNRLKTKLRFLDLEEREFFTVKDIVNFYNLHPNDTKWIKNMRKTGFIERINEKPPHKYFMTEKALGLKETLKAWKADLSKLTELKGITDLAELQYSLKAHPRLPK